MSERARGFSRLLFLIVLVGALHCHFEEGNMLAQAAAQASAQSIPLPSGVEKVASVEGITEYLLPNGLRALIFPEPSKPTITVNMTYQVGSAAENYGETGMAHLLEHLMFKGSPKHTDIPQELTEHGARPNGTTSEDRTNYFETFTASDENLDWALDLEADRMVNSFIAKKDLDSEMTVVRNEFENGENNPFRVLEERVLSSAYLWHNYGKSPIGARSDIENVPIERLQAFYRTYYQPDNAVLVVAGKLDETKTLALIVNKFGSIPKPTRALTKFYTDEPTQDGERTVVLRRVGDTQLVMAAYHIPASPHPDYAAAMLLGNILGSTPSGRLYKALVETKKASSVGNGYTGLHYPGVLEFDAEVREGNSLEEVRDVFLDTLETIAARPITNEELERERTAFLRDLSLRYNNTEQLALNLSNGIAAGDWRLNLIFRDRLKETKLEDVQRVAAAYLKSSNRTLGLFYPTQTPDRAEIAPTPDVASMVKDYKGDAAVAAGEAFDPSIANIESRTTRLSLPSGLKMSLLPKKTRGAQVTAQLILHFGDEKSLSNLNVIPDAAGEMLMRGTARHTRQEIKDEFDRLKAQVMVFGSTMDATARIVTERDNLAEALKLVAEVLREPSFPESEFEPMREEWLAGLDQRRSQPIALAQMEMQRHMDPYPKGHPLYPMSIDEEASYIQSLTLDAVRKFYRDFYGGSNMEISVVGDFDDKVIGDLIEDLFGTWKSPRPFARVPRSYFEVAASDRSVETPDKPNAMFLARQNLAIRDDDPDYPALVLANYMLGGGFLNSRMAVRIRQKDGLSYTVQTGFMVSSTEKAGLWRMLAIMAPQNAGRVEAAFKEELERALKDGFTTEEVAAAKSGFLQSQQVQRAQDANLCSKLTNYLFLNRTMDWDGQIEKKIQDLTPEQILAAMRRHLDLQKMSIVKAGDFKAAAAKSN